MKEKKEERDTQKPNNINTNELKLKHVVRSHR